MFLNSISRKVLIGYTAIILIVAIVSSVLFSGLVGVNKVTDDFVEKSLPAIQNVNKVNHSLNRLLVSAYGLYGYTIEKDAFEATVNDEFTSLESTINKINRNVKAANKVQFSQLKQLLETFKMVMTSGEVDWDAARTSLTEIQDEVSRLEHDISQVAVMISKQLNNKTKQITSDVSRMTMWLVLSVMSILLITVGAYFFAKKHIVTPVNSLSSQLDNLVANNDLRIDVDVNSNDEVLLTANSVNKLLAAFRQVNRDIGQSASIVKDSIELLNHSATLSDEEVDKLSEVVATMMASSEQLERSIADASNRSEVASEIAQTGAAQVELGKTNISETANIITDLSNDIDNSAEMLLSLKNAGDKVSDVVKTIADIADQTNLLALNAAIEAARAGESGRGFAVVAGEVRTLAKRTHDSTYEINSILEQIVTSISSTVGAMEVNKSKANEAVNAAQITVDSLMEIQVTVLSLGDENRTLATASQSSQLDVGRMKRDIDNINVGMSVVTESSAKTKSAAATLANLSIELEQAAQQFKT